MLKVEAVKLQEQRQSEDSTRNLKNDIFKLWTEKEEPMKDTEKQKLEIEQGTFKGV